MVILSMLRFCRAAGYTLLASAVLMASTISPVRAQSGQNTPTSEQIDQFVVTTLKDQPIPGLAVAVIKNGQVLLNKAYGLADVENGLLVTPGTRFEAASLTKPLVAIALMQLVEAGKVELDQPLRMYIAEAPTGPDAWGGVTMRQALTHTAGLPYSVDTPTKPDGTFTEQDFLRAAVGAPLNAKPGERWEYSDFGYQLITLVIARVSGLPAEKYIQARIFEPAGMKSAVINPDMPDGTAAGYRLTQSGVVRSGDAPDQPLFFGGGMYLSLQDYIAWDAALTQGLLLKPETLRQMWQPATLNDGSQSEYGLGWTTRMSGGGLVTEHGGGSDLVSHRFVRYIDENLSVVVLSNLRLARVWDIAYGIGALFNPALQPPKDSPIAADDTAPEITALLRTVFQGMVDGTLDRNLFTPELQALYDDFLQLGNDLRTVGIPQTFTLLEQSEADGVRTYRYAARLDGVKAFITIGLDENDKIAQFEIGV
jgi:CubicO group peptidase (beta-lactamase class C family)